MAKTKIEFIEVVHDPELRKKEKAATEAARRICPNCGPVVLYRTADGRIGFQTKLGVAAGERKLLDDIYLAIMHVLGIRRGRRTGVKTVQTKLRLPEPVYLALKNKAAKSKASLSAVVAELARREMQVAETKSAKSA